MRWMRTWCTAGPGESYLSVLLVFRRPFSSRTPGILLPQMYDSEAERRRLERQHSDLARAARRGEAGGRRRRRARRPIASLTRLLPQRWAPR